VLGRGLNRLAALQNIIQRFWRRHVERRRLLA
jgi:hypothetical protein